MHSNIDGVNFMTGVGGFLDAALEQVRAYWAAASERDAALARALSLG